ncbi:hypothetical protein CBR_g294 [Chara braunii]|uniref:Uncharacterized protein n=1 Tax=Chara braunii TaxID=69332 RepID=A0A388JQ81_CHABU|nr:hypothetical protein CBR_g294 [Chara braunii]|eukprot:GBG59964.1 hypothetical protein CBR_g294 [Chara braunii]
MGTRPLLAARYMEEKKEWQVATYVSFAIPRIDEGQNVATILQEKITTFYHLGVFETDSLATQQDDRLQEALQGERKVAPDQTDPKDTPMDQINQPELGNLRSFTPLIAKMPEDTKLKEGMRRRPWNTVTAIHYSVLTGIGLPAELQAASLAGLITKGIFEGDGDFDSKAYPIDMERDYHDECSEEEMEEDEEDWTTEKDEGDSEAPLTKEGSSSIGEYRLDVSLSKTQSDPPGESADSMETGGSGAS